MNLLLFEGLPPHLLARQWALRSRVGTALVSRNIWGRSESKSLIPLKIKSQANER
jgi:hypothetical protein